MSDHGFTGKSYDNTIDLGADTWRHVAFIEQTVPADAREDGGRSRAAQRERRDRGRRRDLPGGRRPAVADGLRRVQALHRRRLPGGLPHGRAVPHRVRDGGRSGGHLQRLWLLRPRLPVRRSSTSARTTGAYGSARCATTGSRTTRNRPAPRPARPTRSSSASSRSCASEPSTACATSSRPDRTRPSSTWPTTMMGSAGPAHSFCSWTSPRSTASRPIRSIRERHLGEIWSATALAALALGGALVAAAFGGRR